MSSATRRVWVRGAGAISPLGETWPDTRAALAEGATAVAPVTRFDATGFPSTVAAAIPREFPGVEDRRLALASIAAREAWRTSGYFNGSAEPRRTGVFVGAESGRASPAKILAMAKAAGGGKTFDHVAFGRDARALAPYVDAAAVSPAAVASALAGEIGAIGPARTLSLACSSGLAAIIEGMRAIRLGTIDVALCGGVGADVDPLMLAGFGKLSALSAKGISCPFDLRRDGFVVGEGAAFIVLSADRGSAIAELAGSARTLDAHHLTAPDPEGDGAARAMAGALADAGVTAVDYVQAHGTSTPLNDAIEAMALRRVLGASLASAHVGGVKGALGHWVAGAGAIGFLCALEAVEHGVCLPTAGLTQPDPACDLPHVMGRAITADVRAALVNAFAFGGSNACAVLRRAP